ncbi:MAG: hypothetical protein L0332_04965 [Chloroflexi bacterium]|nr:hypothetical protein [Chloroflexota bacterium]MCI0580361.1 hypothetical protein [Chloroflexota bacterium]MCI0649527.1 hypothetical protein [Chloroflexota bacterium]MCI0726058.1 hypothetical protein [Chloroflexota bacterium]
MTDEQTDIHGHQHERPPFLGQLQGLWERVPRDIRLNLEHNFLPEDPLDRPLPGERVQLVIRMALYRDLIGHIYFHHFRLVLFITLVLCALMALVVLFSGLSPLIILIPLALLILVGALAFKERIEYIQRQLIKTNARLIISIPQHGAFPLVDNIEIKGVPTVLDTNWSRNPLWRIFQAATGARDLYISLTAYQFVEGAARVRDALIMPDIMPNEVFELKKLVFTTAPPPTRFVEPQEVVVVRRDGQE